MLGTHIEVDYYLALSGGKRRVRGVQVGRFAVRHAVSADVAPWRVDHIPTGLAVSAFETFEDAYALADDISRFSQHDPSSKNKAKAAKQIGPQVGRWMFHINKGANMAEITRGEVRPIYVSFREWLEGQGETWKPQKMKFKLPSWPND
jgi:hypothetical protein